MDGINARFDFRAPVPDLEDLGPVHFIAIGGSGMSAVARLLLAQGVAVSGSDAQDSAGLRALEALGARVSVGHDATQVRSAQTIVISSAIRETNVELAAARKAGLRVLHRSQALAAAMKGSARVAVAGANGKTTTTSMLVVALQEAGLAPAFASGGELVGQGTNAQWDTGPGVIEADESDGSFLVYRPRVGVITNVQPDHLDFYGSFAQVQAAYVQFALSIEHGGLLVACADDAGSLAVAASTKDRRVLTYGAHGEADLQILSSPGLSTQGPGDDLGTLSRIRTPDGEERELRLAIPGQHNVLNACAAYLAAVEGFGADPQDVLAGLANFAGARRRFEVLGERGGVTVVDDYAHNPGKVAAVISTAAQIAHQRGGRLGVIFQPHLYSRTRDFAAGFAHGLAPADRVAVIDIYGAREEPVTGVGPELITSALAPLAGDREIFPGSGAGEAADWLIEGSSPGDLLLLVGAGDVTHLGPRVLAALEER